MAQLIEEFNTEEISRVEAQRKWVREHFTPETEHQYETVSGKLALINTILKNKWIEPTETVKLQCLGIAFGDALAQELDLLWRTIEDEYGRDPCLIVEGTSIILFPLTMISKRVENGEDVDVYSLFKESISQLPIIKDKLV